MSGGNELIPPNLGSLFRPASNFGPGGVKLIDGTSVDDGKRDKPVREITPEWAQEEEVHRRLVTEIREAESRGDVRELPRAAHSASSLPTSSRPYEYSSFTPPHANGHHPYPPPQPPYRDRDREQWAQQPWAAAGSSRSSLAAEPTALFAFPSLVGAMPTGTPTADDIIYRASIGGTLTGLIAGGASTGSGVSLRDAKSVQSQL